MNKKVGFLSSVCCLLFPAFCFARLGGAGATFMGIGGGTRAIGMGGAYTACADGIEAIFWNPSGIANIKNVAFAGTHVNLFAGMSYENIAFVYPLRDGAIGISAIGLLSGNIEVTTPEEQDGTGEFFSCNDYCIGITYGRMMTDKFTAGATIKAINMNIAKVSANGVAFDIGATYSIGIKGLKFGFSMSNFGPDCAYRGEDLERTVGWPDYESIMESDIIGEWRSEKFSLPLTFQVGASVKLLTTQTSTLTIEADLVHSCDQKETYAVGMEYCMMNKYFGRLGYTEKNNIVPPGIKIVDRLLGNLTAGVGITTTLPMMGQFTVDYSYESHQYLSGIHRISLGFAL